MKLQLGENHRRAVPVLLRGIDRMCSDVEACLKESSGVLEALSHDLSRSQREQLKTKAAQIRAEIARMASEISLDTSVLSLRRKVYALSAGIVNLEESDPKNCEDTGRFRMRRLRVWRRNFICCLQCWKKWRRRSKMAELKVV